MNGTALQAIKFSLGLANGMGERFLRDWLSGIDLSLWRVQLKHVKDTTAVMPVPVSFEQFCEMNPDMEPTLAELVARTFKEYGDHHMAKEPPDIEKANRNYQLHNRVKGELG